MRELNIYDSGNINYKRVLTKLLESALAQGKKAVIYCKDQASIREIDGMLWSSKQLSFIPHCTEEDGLPLALQKIYITTKYKNPIQAQLFIILNTEVMYNSIPDTFEKILYFPVDFMQAAKLRLEQFKIYLVHQKEDGSWQKINTQST